MSKRDAPEDLETPPAKQQKVEKPEYTFNVNNALDKAHETKSLTEAIELPPSALQGLADSADPKLAKLKINTIKELGEWKFFKIAKAIVALAEVEEDGKRNAEGSSNFNAALCKAWETKSLKEMVDAPISAFEGLAAWVDTELSTDLRPGIHSIKDLANWKYCIWAEALVTLAEFENADHTSR